MRRGRFISLIVPGKGAIANVIPLTWRKTSGNASCIRLAQMHVVAPWLAISVARRERHVDARQRISWTEGKDEMERMFSSGPCSMSGMFAASSLRALEEIIFSSGTCSMRGIMLPRFITLPRFIMIPRLHAGMLVNLLLRLWFDGHMIFFVVMYVIALLF